VLRLTTDLRIPPTANQAERDLRPAKSSRRYRAGSAPSRPPATGTPSAATSPPLPSTALMCSPPSTTPWPGTPGCHPSPHPRNPCRTVSPSHGTNRACGDLNVYPQGGAVAPPTQWMTGAWSPPCRFDGVVAWGRAVCGCGDAVPDGDLLGPDEDVFDQLPQHPIDGLQRWRWRRWYAAGWGSPRGRRRV